MDESNDSIHVNNMPEFLALHFLSNDRLYVFWQLEEEKVRFISKFFDLQDHQFNRFLRLHVYNERKQESIFEVMLRPGQSSWIFKGVSKDDSFLAEIGLNYQEGSFFPLLRSIEHAGEGTSRKQSRDSGDNHPNWTSKVSTYSYYEDLEGSTKSGR